MASVYRLSQFSLALHGSAGLLAAMLEEGIPRDEIEAALSRVLDDIEQQIARMEARAKAIRSKSE